jgi:hypothetical protein
MEGLLGRYAEVRLAAVRDAMAAIEPEAGERLLRQWGEAGARIVETREIVEDALLEPRLAG